MDREYENSQDHSNETDTLNFLKNQIENRKNNYKLRFGEKVDSEDFFLLSEDICRAELKKAEAILSDKYKYVDAKIISYDDYPGIKGVIEINVDGRRFSIPRDGITDYGYDNNPSVDMSSSVVSILEKERWPKKHSFTMTPKIEAALNFIDGNSLVDNVMDLAKYLQLGDRFKINKNNLLNSNLIDKTLKEFGVDDEASLRKILRSIGLELIVTTDRLADVDNRQTEIDALLEAIEKRQSKKLKY